MKPDILLIEPKVPEARLDVDLARQRLSELKAAPSLDVLGRLRSVGLHKLKGDLRGFWSVAVNGPWRILFKKTGMRTRSTSSIRIERAVCEQG